MDKKSATLDATDIAILEMLQRDAFMTTKDMAAQLHLSATPVFERVRRLEREGYILRYVAQIDRRKIGLPLLIFCEVSLREHNRDFLVRFEEQVAALNEVLECHHITGDFDYLLKVVAADIDDYQQFIKEKLAALENIGRVQSHFVMTEVKNETAYAI